MTRGYICLTNGMKVKDVAYLSSDAYLLWYGKEILNHIKHDTFEKFMEDVHKENEEEYGKDDPCRNFKMNWIRPNAESRSYGKGWSYAEYGYVYDYKRTLKVYHFGKLLFTVWCIDPEEIEKYLYIFRNEDALYDVTSYDPEKLCDSLSFDKFAKEVRDLSLDQLKELVKKSDEERIYLSDYHTIAPGHEPNGGETYYKTLSSSDQLKKALVFVVQHNGRFTEHGWIVCLQTPFGRFEAVHSPYKYGAFRSEKAAMRGIRDCVKKVGADKLFRTAEILDRYEAAKDDEKLRETLYNTLEDEWERSPWWSVGNVLTTNKLRSRLSEILL